MKKEPDDSKGLADCENFNSITHADKFAWNFLPDI